LSYTHRLALLPSWRRRRWKLFFELWFRLFHICDS
jgi:hypothetical protein